MRVAAVLLALLSSATALAASSVTKHARGTVTLPAGATRTLVVPYPDALEYGNARYSGSWKLAVAAGARGTRPDLARVSILSSGSALGGSEFRLRVRNANRSGTAAVLVTAIATTVEPLPHH